MFLSLCLMVIWFVAAVFFFCKYVTEPYTGSRYNLFNTICCLAFSFSFATAL